MRVGFKQIVTAAAGILLAGTASAYGQVDAGTPEVEPVEPTAEPAAPQSQVSGLVEPRDPPESGGRKTGRVLLYPVRGLWYVVWAPVRGFAWAYDRYAIPNRIRRIFFSEDGRVGLFPIFAYKSGFGITAGARFEVRELLSPGSRLRLSATYRGEVLQSYILRHRTGELFGPAVEVETTVGFETFPRSRFFGIGNGDQEPAGTHMGDVDALRDDTAVGTVFYYDAFSAETAVSVDVPGPVRVRLAGGYRLRDFDEDVDVDVDDDDDRFDLDDDDWAIDEIYDVNRLVGWQENLSNVYGEAALILNTLRPGDRALSAAMPATGWYLRGRLGLVGGLSDDPSEYWRYGADVQRYIDLYGGDRILALRASFEGVSGSMSDVPFSDLPRLGGPILLRGYQQDRFRDRRAGVATVEYQWGVDRNVSAFLFADAGRVWRNLDDLDLGLDELRVGFGGGLEIHSMKNFIGRAMLASSKDGSAFLTLSFDPLYDAKGRP
jgi:hypothetical protein